MEGNSCKKRRFDEVVNDFDSSIAGGRHEILSAEGADRDSPFSSPLSSPLGTPPPASQDSIDLHSSDYDSSDDDLSSIKNDSDESDASYFSDLSRFFKETQHFTNEQYRDHVNHLIELHQKAEEAEEDHQNYGLDVSGCNETDSFADSYIRGWNEHFYS